MIYGTAGGANWTSEQKKYRYQVRAAVRYAILRGELPRLAVLNCVCGLAAKEYHHDDYGSPLAVRPLCKDCHFAWHKQNGHGLIPDELPDLAGMFSRRSSTGYAK